MFVSAAFKNFLLTQSLLIHISQSSLLFRSFLLISPYHFHFTVFYSQSCRPVLDFRFLILCCWSRHLGFCFFGWLWRRCVLYDLVEGGREGVSDRLQLFLDIKRLCFLWGWWLWPPAAKMLLAWIMANMLGTHLSKSKLLRGSIMIAQNPVLCAASSSSGSAQFSPISSPSRSKFGSKIGDVERNRGRNHHACRLWTGSWRLWIDS